MNDRLRIGVRLFEPFISASKIAEQVGIMAKKINHTLALEDPLCLIALKGGFMFAADLLRLLDFDPEVEFIGLRSYQGVRSSGSVDIVHALDRKRVAGRSVLIIEDIVDTGLTLRTMLDHLDDCGAKEVVTAVLLFKPDALKTQVEPDHFGFSIPNAFVVGYGLDYNQRGRSLPEIYREVS